jgi:hypothetical protein
MSDGNRFPQARHGGAAIISDAAPENFNVKVYRK